MNQPIAWQEKSPLGLSYFGLVTLMILLVALSLLPGDNVTPLLPLMEQAFDTSSNTIQQVVSFYLLALGISQIFLGIANASYSSHRLCMIMTTIFGLGSFMISITHSIYVVFLGRILQGIGAANCLVLSRIYLQTFFPSNQHMTQVSSYCMIAVSMTVAIAPFIAGIIASILTWQANFTLLALICLCLVLFFYRCVTPYPTQTTQQSLTDLIKHHLALSTFIRFTTMTGLCLAFIMIYYTLSPFILSKLCHLPVYWVGTLNALSGIPIFFASRLICWAQTRYGTTNYQFLQYGLLLMLGGALCIFIPSLFNILTPWVIVPPYLISVLGTSLLFPNTFIMAMKEVKSPAIASGLYGSIQFLIASLISFLSSLAPDTSQKPLGIWLIIICLLIAYLLKGHRR